MTNKYQLWYLTSDTGEAEKWHMMGHAPDFKTVLSRLSTLPLYENLAPGVNKWQIVRLDELDCFTVILNLEFFNEGGKR